MYLSQIAAITFALLSILEVGAQEILQPEPKPDCKSVVSLTQCKCSKPTYPTEALRRSEQGTTIVKVGVESNGLVGTVELLKSSGSSNLDRATLEHFKTLCFKPARNETGNEIPSSTIVKYIWQIE